ncbi:permease [Helicobacter pametensis]|uniref:permease n=1 Tax=Helicobacter pametensis TaxID=95149 RepID=UPI00048A0DB4|nr:permease [Helicobacter pametensis]
MNLTFSSYFVEFFKLFFEISFLFFAVGMLMKFLQHRYANTFQKYLARDSLFSYWRGILLGVMTPFCSCSTIPVFRSLLQTKCSFGASMAYLLTSPLLNPITFVLLLKILDWKIAVFYTLFIMFSIFMISVFVAKIDSKSLLSDEFARSLSPRFSLTPTQGKCCATSCCSASNKLTLKGLFISEFQDYKKIFPYLLIGMALGAGIHNFLPTDFLSSYVRGNIWELILLAFVAVFLYIRIDLALPLGLALVQAGMPVGSMMCFLIAGGGASLPEFILLRSMFKWRFLMLFIGIVMGIAISFGWILNHFFSL